MKKLQLIDYALIVGVTAIIGLMAVIVARPAPPCVETLDVTQGQNFNQPILTKHNCINGEVPTNWRNFEPKSGN